MSVLGERIRRLIAEEGPVPVDRFMAICLSDPRHGYYVTRDPLGRGGDFITAPEISQIFGELIGLWAVQVWQEMGSPGLLRLVELGPGRGSLMADAMRAARLLPAFLDAAHLHLVETSPVLRERQEAALRHMRSPSWHAALEEVPPGPTILIANEFFDALPIRQYVRQGGRWLERLVGLGEDDRLVFGLSRAPATELALEAPDGSLLELSPAGLAVVSGVAQRLAASGGAALMIDYGHARSGFGDTLQALRASAYVDPLAEPGEADLTAHVDFAALSGQARAQGAVVHPLLTQATFLERLGGPHRAEALMRAAPDDATRQLVAEGFRRLTARGEREMGRLFKVLALTGPDSPVPPAFASADPWLDEKEPSQ